MTGSPSGSEAPGRPLARRAPRRTCPAAWPTAALLLVPGTLLAADAPSARALDAWSVYVSRVEERLEREWSGDPDTPDTGSARWPAAPESPKGLLEGDVVVERMDPAVRPDELGRTDALVHHWRGQVFVPGIDLDTLLAATRRDPVALSNRADVLAGDVLERSEDGLRLWLRIKRSAIVTAVYDTEYAVQYRRHDAGRATSRSVATRIVELEEVADDWRPKPPAHDRGFLWRLNAYWTYEALAGGVVVTCESISLSRSVPSLVRPVIQPAIDRVARESLRRTLEALRARLTDG